ncbi:MAG TPA: hypothetical protein VH951_07805, partial [Dehalococcoidia bacterium]
ILALFLFRRWKACAGMMSGAAILVVVTLPFTNWQVYEIYAGFITGVGEAHLSGAGALAPSAWQGALDLTAGLNGLFTSLWGQADTLLVDVSTVATAVVLFTAYWVAIHSVRPGLGDAERELMMAATVALLLLIDPHLYPQDLTLAYLCIPTVLAAFRRPWAALLCLIAGFNSMLIDQVFPIHLFTLALAGFVLYCCWRAIRSPGRGNDGGVPSREDLPATFAGLGG